MDTRFPAPISSLLARVEESKPSARVGALMAWLAKLPKLGLKPREGLRERWLAKREAEQAVRPRRKGRPAPVALPPVALDALEPPNDWPSEWHSMVQAIPAKPSQRRKRAPMSLLDERPTNAEEEVEGQAFLSLFSANADRMRDLQLIAQGDHRDGPGRDWWRGR